MRHFLVKAKDKKGKIDIMKRHYMRNALVNFMERISFDPLQGLGGRGP